MRTFGSGFQTKLESGSYAPILLVHYELKEYISGDEPDTGTTVVTDYYWSERETTFDGNTYLPTIINSSPLNMELDASRQVFSEFSLQVGNNLGQLVSVIQSGMKATVYFGFQESDGSVVDAEVMFIGTVEGDIEITEDSVSFNLQDIAYSYDRQIPNLIDEVNFVGAGREDIGEPLPLVFGRAKDHICRSVTGQFTTAIAEDVNYTFSGYDDIFQLWNTMGSFKQTVDDLRNRSAGADWYTDWNYDNTMGDINVACSTDISDYELWNTLNPDRADGLDIGALAYPPSGLYDSYRTFWINDLKHTFNIVEDEWYQVRFTVLNWEAGTLRVVGQFKDSNGDVFDGSTETSGLTRKLNASNPALPINSTPFFFLKGAGAVETPQLGFMVSHDFRGKITFDYLGKSKSNAGGYFYVTDDIAHWKKKHLVADDDNNLTLDLDVAVDYTPEETNQVTELNAGETIRVNHTVTDIEFDADGFAVKYGSNPEPYFLSPYATEYPEVSGNRITFPYGDDVEDYFAVGEYVYIENNRPANWDDTDASQDVFDNGLAEIDSLSGYSQITAVNTDFNYIEISDELDSNLEVILDDEFIFAEFAYNTVTLQYGQTWLDYGYFQSGTTIQIGLSSYTIQDVSSDVMTLADADFGSPYTTYDTFNYSITLYDYPMLTWSLRIDNYPKNMWKVSVAEPIQHAYKRGMTVTAITEQDEVFCIADHAVQRVTNLKVNGIALPADIGYVVELESTDHSEDGNTRSFVKIPFESLANVAALALNIDTTNLAEQNTTNVADEITVSDDGHTHLVGASRTYNWAVELQHSSFNYVASQSPTIKIRSGSFSLTIYARTGWMNPIRFTSSSSKCYIDFYDGFNISRTASFERTDSLTGTTQYDYVTKSGTDGYMASRMAEPETTNETTLDAANVIKIGTASRGGDYVSEGYLLLNSPVALSQARSNMVITCDVIGNIDGESGYQPPHHQIKNLINKFATNPISGTEGSANIVQFVNESEMDDYFGKVWNSYSSLDEAADRYPRFSQLSNTNTDSTAFKSPNAELGNSLVPVGNTDTETANAVHYNEIGFHALDFSINSKNQLRDVVGNMLFQANMVCVWRNGIAYLKLLTETPSNNGTLDNSDMVMKTMSLTKSPVADLATDITVLFDRGSEGFSRAYNYAKYDWTGGNLSITKLDATRKYGSYDRDKEFELDMVRDQVAAELLAKRFYQEYAAAKFHSRFTTVLANLAYEPTDNLTVSIPIHRDSMMDRGLVTRKTLRFGSAVERTPDLIDFEIRENHTTSGYYLSLYL